MNSKYNETKQAHGKKPLKGHQNNPFAEQTLDFFKGNENGLIEKLSSNHSSLY